MALEQNLQVVDTPAPPPAWRRSGKYLEFDTSRLSWVTRNGQYLEFDVDLAAGEGVLITRNGKYIEISEA
jgi:hypothetical protein